MKTQLSPGSNSIKFAKKMDKRILSLKGKQKTRNQGCGLSTDTSLFGVLKNLINIHKTS